MTTTLRNDDIRVIEAHVGDGEIELGPDDDKTVETIKMAHVRFADGHAPYARWHWGNMLVATPDDSAQLLRVESMTWQYRYDHEFGQWWASYFDAATVYVEGDGSDVYPRREQPMGCWGESNELTPQWVKGLVEEHRPASGDVPPLPRKKAHR